MGLGHHLGQVKPMRQSDYLLYFVFHWIFVDTHVILSKCNNWRLFPKIKKKNKKQQQMVLDLKAETVVAPVVLRHRQNRCRHRDHHPFCTLAPPLFLFAIIHQENNHCNNAMARSPSRKFCFIFLPLFWVSNFEIHFSILPMPPPFLNTIYIIN